MIRRICASYAFQLCIVTLFLSASFFLFKSPLRFQPIVFLDDGEILYHAFNLHAGGVPYRDDISHHFLGYAVPITILGKLAGFSEYLVRQFWMVNQVVVGILLFMLTRNVVRPGWAIICALLYITAREPFVNGFFIQYELNLIFALALLCAFWFSKTGKRSYLFICWVITSIGFSFDQRALLYAFIPLFMTLKVSSSLSAKVKELVIGSVSWAVVPAIILIYLFINNALYQFYEQTILYPSQFRVGSFTILDMIKEGILLHKYLFTSSIFLTSLAIISYLLLALDSRFKEIFPVPFRQLLLCLPLPLFFISALGSRDFDYYTIVWLPYFAILASIFPRYLDRQSLIQQYCFGFIYLAAMVPPYINSYLLRQLPYLRVPYSDGIDEVEEYLKANMSPTDTLFVWGYRLDLLVRLERLSHLPFTNQIMLHPDSKIRGEKREAHVFRPYLSQFLGQLRDNPPSIIVKTGLRNLEQESSFANEEVGRTLQAQYDLVFSVEKESILKNKSYFEVYRVRN